MLVNGCPAGRVGPGEATSLLMSQRSRVEASMQCVKRPVSTRTTLCNNCVVLNFYFNPNVVVAILDGSSLGVMG